MTWPATAGTRAEATRLYQAGLAIAQRLVELTPDNTGFQRDLSVSYERLGDLARDGGDRAEATRLYQATPWELLRRRLTESCKTGADLRRSGGIAWG